MNLSVAFSAQVDLFESLFANSNHRQFIDSLRLVGKSRLSARAIAACSQYVTTNNALAKRPQSVAKQVQDPYRWEAPRMLLGQKERRRTVESV